MFLQSACHKKNTVILPTCIPYHGLPLLKVLQWFFIGLQGKNINSLKGHNILFMLLFIDASQHLTPGS